MTLRQLLSPQARAALFDPPMEVRAIVRHYTFSIEDVALIRQRRRNANRLGFAVHLAYLRFPGRVLGPKETPPAHLLAFIADQLRINPKAFEDYAQRDETRVSTSQSCRPILGCGRLVAKTTGPWLGSLSMSRLVPNTCSVAPPERCGHRSE
jgi:TnpA family transposase